MSPHTVRVGAACAAFSPTGASVEMGVIGCDGCPTARRAILKTWLLQPHHYIWLLLDESDFRTFTWWEGNKLNAK